MKNRKSEGALMLKVFLVLATATVSYSAATFSPKAISVSWEKMCEMKRINAAAKVLEDNLPKDFAQARDPIYLHNDVHYVTLEAAKPTVQEMLKRLPQVEAYSHKVYSVGPSPFYPDCKEDPVLAQVVQDKGIESGYFVTEVITPPDQR